MNNCIVFIDGGFLSKISKYFGNGNHIKYDLKDFIENLVQKENLIAKKIFYYNAPPFQSPKPTDEENLRKEKYDKFVFKLKEKGIIVKEGRCQRIKENGSFVYNQKGVDISLALDIIAEPIKNNIDKIILIACDSDFVPAIKQLAELKINTILYTFFQNKRKREFATSNELIKSVHKYILLTKQDFEKFQFKK